MKTFLLALSMIILLTGCGETLVIRKEPYAVYMMVPTTPKPPKIEPCEYLVDQLTDNADAGTVVQAYKHDMACLRSKITQYENVLSQYDAAADKSIKVEQEIKQQFERVLEQYKRELESLDRTEKP